MPPKPSAAAMTRSTSYSVRWNVKSPPSHDRPGRARVAVERHAGRAGVRRARCLRAAPAELDVRVAEHERAADAAGRRATRRRAAARARSCRRRSTSSRARRRRRRPRRARAGGRATRSPRRRSGADVIRRFATTSGRSTRRLAHPALAVAADEDRRLVDLAQRRERLALERAEADEVAAEQERRRSLRARVGEHRLERGQVRVDVVQHREHARVVSST